MVFARDSLTFSHDGRYLHSWTPGEITEIWDLRRLRARLGSMNLDWED